RSTTICSCLASSDPEKRVQRAEPDQAGRNKYSGKRHQYDTYCTSERPGKEEHCNDRCDDQPDDPVHCTHVHFHDLDFFPQRSGDRKVWCVMIITKTPSPATIPR